MSGNSRGVALAEVLIATLLAAIIVAGVFGAALSSHQMIVRSDVRTQANAAAKLLSDRLGNYVAPDSPVIPAGNIPAAFAPGACWNIVNPAVGGCPGGWALSDGFHAVNFLLPVQLQNNNAATLSYTVCTCGVSCGGCPAGSKQITINVAWTESTS